MDRDGFIPVGCKVRSLAIRAHYLLDLAGLLANATGFAKVRILYRLSKLRNILNLKKRVSPLKPKLTFHWVTPASAENALKAVSIQSEIPWPADLDATVAKLGSTGALRATLIL